MSRPAKEVSREQGFTLLEVIVALMILALALGAMLSAMTTGLSGERRVARADRALSIARSQLALVEAMPELGPTRQTFIVERVFKVAIEMKLEKQGRMATGREIGLFDVGVDVSYGGTHTLTLSERLVRNVR
ncbi:type II secretion system protein [Gluconobacter japonicus]|uniref:type IV pilus modification PilV family protein n=1 Tax=Gluconobacter TaxID=441 RepID=UPI00158452D2|nr:MULTISPECIES: type II secretion system protein [Gluconobacter]MBS1038988.1 type II secretion system protein [Gluconobacter cerinus]MBS1045677.1 type II secretion system protein [Gluconobacter cerinus]MDI6654119.1 type II secretion system protein [Gluconobacter japonicus]